MRLTHHCRFVILVTTTALLACENAGPRSPDARVYANSDTEYAASAIEDGVSGDSANARIQDSMVRKDNDSGEDSDTSEAGSMSSDTLPSDLSGNNDTTGTDGDAIPTEVDALLSFLQAGHYADWVSESEVHASAGPHFGDVRTFLNSAAANALSTGAISQPVGSALVKELYGQGDTVLGWAVMAKVEETDGPDSWYWYEYSSVRAGGKRQRACDYARANSRY